MVAILSKKKETNGSAIEEVPMKELVVYGFSEKARDSGAGMN